MTLEALARTAGIGRSTLHRIEAGEVAAIETYVRIGEVLNVRPTLAFDDGRFKPVPSRGPSIDIVHSAMGELEAHQLTEHGFGVAIDEPYQHYQFAGRADVVGWDLDARALLHVENRTQFPNLQDAAGSYNAKRAYLPAALAERLGVPRGWTSVTHVMAVLWSSEALHTLRLRPSTFAAVCPDPVDRFQAWWEGHPPPDGLSSSLVVLDPLPLLQRKRRFVGLDAVTRVGPRYRDYADAARALRAGR